MRPRDDVYSRLARRSLTTSWLASRLAVEPGRLEAMRRGGELVGVRVPGTYETLFPAWQFGRDGRPADWLPRIVAAAREAGIDDRRLDEVLQARSGLGGRRRLVELLRAGEVDDVVAAVRRARPR